MKGLPEAYEVGVGLHVTCVANPGLGFLGVILFDRLHLFTPSAWLELGLQRLLVPGCGRWRQHVKWPHTRRRLSPAAADVRGQPHGGHHALVGV
jgi:hypothetical protein